MIAGHAALLALEVKRPVKLIYDRHEDMLATTKRHPARVRHRTGVRRDGTLVAQDIDVLMDGGAYVTLSPVVLSRGILHATGPYECPNVRVVGRVVATSTPPNGAFCGFGAPQTLFAAELQMEKIAARLQMDPVEIRRKNLLREGALTATGTDASRERRGVDCAQASTCTKPVCGQEEKICPVEPVEAPAELARHRGCRRLSRRRVHGRRGSVSAKPGSRRAFVGWTDSRGRGCDRDRPGHDEHPRSNRGRCARSSLRLGRGRNARHEQSAGQRPHRGQPHVHDRGRAVVSRGKEAQARASECGRPLAARARGLRACRGARLLKARRTQSRRSRSTTQGFVSARPRAAGSSRSWTSSRA